ncbi:hypothetical protein [Stakelama pacifica]|uniref:Uncharacterized protein n=1 Tax=Stakelama pacifica TaxID=517720 RepID=A0A4R6FCG5_9SPHN|nr:hypothetical protein [Stakelama pacifica]TDN78792.1 hypothetical protein EV664_11556 [Stakelama pacifica]
MTMRSAQPRFSAAVIGAAIIPLCAAALVALAVIEMPDALLKDVLAPITHITPDATFRALLALGAAIATAALCLSVVVELWSARLTSRRPRTRSLPSRRETPAAKEQAEPGIVAETSPEPAAAPVPVEVAAPAGALPEAPVPAPAGRQPALPHPDSQTDAPPVVEAVPVRPAPLALKPSHPEEENRTVSATPAFPAPSPDTNITLLLERLERGLDRRERHRRSARKAAETTRPVRSETPLRSVLDDLRKRAVTR